MKKPTLGLVLLETKLFFFIYFGPTIETPTVKLVLLDMFEIFQINQIILSFREMQKPTLCLCLYCINNLVHIYYKETNTWGGSVGDQANYFI